MRGAKVPNKCVALRLNLIDNLCPWNGPERGQERSHEEGDSLQK